MISNDSSFILLPIRSKNNFGFWAKLEDNKPDGNFLRFPPKLGSSFNKPNNPCSFKGPI